MEKFDTIELAFCISDDRFIKVPIDRSVQEGLKEMHDTFYQKYNNIKADVLEFGLSEKYAGSEKLYASIDKEYVSCFKSLFFKNDILSSEIKISDIFDNIAYYFAIFSLKNKKVAIGVKRPSQFKGLLKKKLMTISDDMFKLIGDKIFNLDVDFDFVIKEKQIDILHPTGFINLSEMSDDRQKEIANATKTLVKRVEFINFNEISDFVAKNKIAARYIASIKSRQDLELTQRENLCEICDELKITYTIDDKTGIITPDKKCILNFLCVLDRREYEINLTGITERYRAATRSLQK